MQINWIDIKDKKKIIIILYYCMIVYSILIELIMYNVKYILDNIDIIIDI